MPRYISETKTVCRNQAVITCSIDSYLARCSYMMMACITSSEFLREEGIFSIWMHGSTPENIGFLLMRDVFLPIKFENVVTEILRHDEKC